MKEMEIIQHETRKEQQGKNRKGMKACKVVSPKHGKQNNGLKPKRPLVI